MTKVVAITLLVSTSFMMSGCYGSFALVSKVHEFNGNVSDSKFINELVFLGFCIIPVYGLAALGDAIIFNSIEFWSGSNPVAMNENETEESEIMHEGQLYKLFKSKNNLTVADANGAEVHFTWFPKEKSWYLMDGENKTKAVEMKENAVFTYLPNNKTLVFDQHNAQSVEATVMGAR
jgi:hypothetical protein